MRTAELLILMIIIETTENKINQHLFDDYNRAENPIQDDGSPITIDINMEINSFGQIDAKTMQFTLTTILRQTWIDKRLKNNANNTIVLNYMKSKIWLPDLYFPRAVRGHLHEITEPNFLIWLQPSGEVNYSQKISVDMSCILDLWQYPMDDQMCAVDISSYGYSTREIVLKWMYGNNNPKNVLIRDKGGLNEFTFENVKTTNESTCSDSPLGDFPCIQVKFYLKRKLQYYLVNTYGPTILIMIISWLSFLIDFTSAPARISLGLLSILTLITQGSTVIQTMPKISYIKAIDVWLFTCLAFVIVALLEFAFINSFCREGPKPMIGIRKLALSSLVTMVNPRKKPGLNEVPNEEDAEKEDSKDNQIFLGRLKMEKTMGYRIDNMFFILYPAAFCIFNIIYWSIYNRHYVITKT